jgi:hypothetical protein
LLQDLEGRRPAPFWQAGAETIDTRLIPGKAERVVFEFPEQATRVRVRLLYRRFWPDVAAAKSWPKNELTVLEQTTTAHD